MHNSDSVETHYLGAHETGNRPPPGFGMPTTIRKSIGLNILADEAARDLILLRHDPFALIARGQLFVDIALIPPAHDLGFAICRNVQGSVQIVWFGWWLGQLRIEPCLAPRQNAFTASMSLIPSCRSSLTNLSCKVRFALSALARLGTINQGQGHAITVAQILNTKTDIPADQITIKEDATDAAPYGLGTYGSRSTPDAGAATTMAGHKIRAKAQMIAAYLLAVHDHDLDWDMGRFVVKDVPERLKTMNEIAYTVYT